MAQDFPFQHRHKACRVRIDDDGALELYVDDCLRKRREPGDAEPRYVWTNVELEWEEHHYIEARLWRQPPRLLVTANRTPILEVDLHD